MFHHFRNPPPEDESHLRMMSRPARYMLKAQAVSVAEPRHWDVPGRTELAEMRAGLPRCRRCGGNIISGECLMCGRPA